MKAYVYGANGAAITDVAKPAPKGMQVLVEDLLKLQQKDGGWSCNSTAMQPVEVGVALSGP